MDLRTPGPTLGTPGPGNPLDISNDPFTPYRNVMSP